MISVDAWWRPGSLAAVMPSEAAAKNTMITASFLARFRAERELSLTGDNSRHRGRNAALDLLA